MSRVTNLTGATYGPFKIIEDKRKRFYDPVSVRTKCCDRVIKKKTIIALNTARWRGAKACSECARNTWSDFTQFEHMLVLRARQHGLVPQWRGMTGAKRMLKHLGKRPSDAHVLGLKDASKAHGPTNSVWMTPSELLVSRKLAVAVKTKDGKITTIPHVAKKLGLSRQAIHQRQERGYTLEEATRTPKGVTPPRLLKLRANKGKR